MCGICGILTPDGLASRPEYPQAIRAMTAGMERRGPDAEGFWADPAGCLQLGFRRLAVLDLSPAANQPMLSGDGHSVIVFNGELYNYLELRHELERSGVNFRTRSDTEVLLEALNLWGLETLPRLNGMFAFAWYFIPERTLVLGRDHAGIKPLYYFLHPAGKGLAFASQYDTLLQTPFGKPGDVRPDVLRLYLQLHHIPAPYALLENTFQLEPGACLIVRPERGIETRTWWRMPLNPQATLTENDGLEAISAALQASIRRQRLADVPLGVFLSGGIDSPLITAITRQQAGSGLKAFTIGTPGWGQDESEAARRYAEYLGVDFHLHATNGEEALSTIPEAIAAQHEPFADFSILPALLVSRFARQGMTVALSGDGGDELFFGYMRPVSLLRDGKDFYWPWWVRAGLYAAGKYRLGPPRSDVIVARTPGHYYFQVNCRLKDADLSALAPGLPSMPNDFSLYAYENYQGEEGLANYSRYVEFYGQLQRGLKKVDLASMHHGLEVRLPLLDREVIETSLKLPPPVADLRDGLRKRVLRQLLARYVPQDSIPQPKLGFSVPLGDWLRVELRPLVEETLFSTDLFPAGVFDATGLRRYWQQHLSGQKDHKWGLWTILSLQWWSRGKVVGG